MRLSSVLAAMLVASFSGTSAIAAAKREPFETVGGWAIERPVDPGPARSCRMTRTEQDARGETIRAVVVSREGPLLMLALADREWDLPPDERISIPLYLDEKPAGSNTIWTGDGQVLRASLSAAILPDLLAARVVTLRAAEGEASFAIPDFAAGYEALRQCDTAKPPAAAEPNESNLPPRARMASYAVGLAVERALRDCDVAATDRQRKAVEAKMTALRTEMAPYEAAIRAQLTKSRGFACPASAQEPGFQEAMRRFIELSPEELAAVIDKQAHAEPAIPKPAVTKP